MKDHPPSPINMWNRLSGKKRSFAAALFLVSIVLTVRHFYSFEEDFPVELLCKDKPNDDVPRPLLVYVSGSSRTGTTYIYNLVRILLRQRDPNTIHGWYEDLSLAAARYTSPDPPKSPALEHTQNDIETWNGALDSFLNTGTTVLVKVHEVKHATRIFSGCDHKDAELMHADCPVDFVIHTHRDTMPQLTSNRRMGWARWLYESDFRDPALFCRSSRGQRARLAVDDWKDPRTWLLQAKSIIHCDMAWKEAAGSKLALEIGMESWKESAGRLALARSIVDKIAAHDGGASRNLMDAVAAVKEADRLRPLDCSSRQAVNPISHFHRGHLGGTPASSNPNTSDEANVLSTATALVHEDPLVRKWRQDHQYI